MIGVPTRRMKSAKKLWRAGCWKENATSTPQLLPTQESQRQARAVMLFAMRKSKRNASTDEECKESKNGVPFLLLAEKRQDGEYPSCRRKKNQNENPLANQAINASLMAKENTEMLSYPLRGCKSNQPRRGIGKDRTVCLFCARVVRFRSSFVQLSLLPCAKSLPVPGKPLSPRGMI